MPLPVGSVAEQGPRGILVGTTSGVEVFAGVGDGELEEGSTYRADETDGAATSVAVGRLNGQSGFDAVAAFGGEMPGVGVLPGLEASGSLTPTAILPVGEAPASVAVADLDGNGTPDIAITDPATDQLWFVTTTETNAFEPVLSAPRAIAAGKTPQDIALADFNSDGRLDLVTADRGAGGISVYLSAE